MTHLDTIAGRRPAITDLNQNGPTTMHLLHEELARAQMAARLGEAQTIRRDRQQTRALRLSRKAEATAQRARLALARAL